MLPCDQRAHAETVEIIIECWLAGPDHSAVGEARRAAEWERALFKWQHAHQAQADLCQGGAEECARILANCTSIDQSNECLHFL